MHEDQQTSDSGTNDRCELTRRALEASFIASDVIALAWTLEGLLLEDASDQNDATVEEVRGGLAGAMARIGELGKQLGHRQ